MRAGTKERMISIMAEAGVAAIMFFSWRDPGLSVDRGNHLNGGPGCRSFAI